MKNNTRDNFEGEWQTLYIKPVRVWFAQFGSVVINKRIRPIHSSKFHRALIPNVDDIFSVCFDN